MRAPWWGSEELSPGPLKQQLLSSGPLSRPQNTFSKFIKLSSVVQGIYVALFTKGKCLGPPMVVKKETLAWNVA